MIFPTTPKVHSNSSEIFRYDFNLIFSEEIIQYSRTFASQDQTPWNQADDAPLLLRAFQRDQECDLKHPGLMMDLISMKQNKTKQTTLLCG